MLPQPRAHSNCCHAATHSAQGIIAQRLREVLPQLVVEEGPGGLLSVKEGQLVYLLLGAAQVDG